jgi:hypothetical protein
MERGAILVGIERGPVPSEDPGLRCASSGLLAACWHFRDSIIYALRGCLDQGPVLECHLTAGKMAMTEKAIELDEHRGMAAQKATDLRRLLADVEANEKALRVRQDELEAHLIAAPAANWQEAAEKARYLLNLFAGTLWAQDPRRQTLIAAVLADFQRLSVEP